MLKCCDKCYPVCDFCLYFRNRFDLNNKNIEDGYCLKHNRKQNSLGQCNDYVCFKSITLELIILRIIFYFLCKKRRLIWKIKTLIWKFK